LVLAACAALTVTAFAASGNVQKSKVTIGEFAVKVTKALGKPAVDQRAAVESLKSLGVNVGDASASLTEGVAARMLADLGVRVSTKNPDSAVTSGKADQLVAVVGMADSAASVLPEADIPGECLQVKNRGACQNCCMTALGGDEFSTACAKFCKTVLPPGQASPTDPTP
jgi:hypothetical protein